MSDAPTDAERIDELEIKLAYQDRLVRELDGLVRTLAERLDKAEREVARLAALQLPTPGHERPPHY